jgi:glycerol-3-phosphate acyltransferase PlsX
MVTAGHTGAAMVAAKLTLGTIPGVDRPALAAVFPNRRGRTVVLDVGANVDSRPEQLLQFAVLGHFYAQEVIGTPRPRIGLLSIGEEQAKGNDVTRDAFGALAATGLRFVGNVEGGDVFNGACDVVVCDGFVGNVLLKSAEAMAELIVGMVREELVRSARTRFGGFLVKPAFENLSRRTDYAEYGAVPLLGVRGGCFIGHGRSNAKAIRSAIRRAAEFASAALAAKIETKLVELAAERAAARGPLPAGSR